MSRISRVLFVFVSLFFFFATPAFSQTVANKIEQATIAVEEGRNNEAINLMVQAREETENPVELTDINLLLGYAHFLKGEVDLAISFYDEALAMAMGNDDELTRDILSVRIYLAEQVGNREDVARFQPLLDEIEAKRAASLEGIWAVNDETGDLVYGPLDMAFPERVGFFVREEPHIFDEQGADVSITYVISDINNKAYMTVYLSNYSGTTLDEYVLFSRRDMVTKYEGVSEILDEKKFFDPGNEERSPSGFYGLRLKLHGPEAFNGFSDEQLWIGHQGDWFVKVRLTFKDAFQDEIDSSINAFLNNVEIGMNEFFWTLRASWRDDMPLCEFVTEDYALKNESEKYSAAEASVLLALQMNEILKEERPEAIPGTFCARSAIQADDGIKVIAYINQWPGQIGEYSVPLYQFNIYGPEWELLQEYQVRDDNIFQSLMTLGKVLVEAEEGPNDPNEEIEVHPEDFHYLVSLSDEKVSVYNYYMERPSFDLAFSEAWEAMTGNKPALFDGSLTEDGSFTLGLNSEVIDAEK